MDGPVYCGEIHATPVNDQDDAHPELTNESLRMLELGYHDRSAVKDALGSVGDRSLGAEVTRWNALKKKIKRMQDQIQEHEDQMFALSVAQRACHKRLEEARVISRLQEEMRRDRQVYPLMPWSVKHGRST
jgi:chromosome segregation ATPase